MKVLMLNGSRREKGCTYTALSIIADSLKDEDVESEIVFVGDDAANGNINALINVLKEKCAEADGFVFGAPVYYAGPSAEIRMVLDRLFMAAKEDLRHKPAAVITSARRAGATASLDALAKYPSYLEMPIVSSSYWNIVHGSKPEEVFEDKEGVSVMKTLGKNMAWILKCIEKGKEAGIEVPNTEARPLTNFIR